MLRTLIRHELLTHLMSARFFAAVIITLLLIVANTVVLIDEYEERVAMYRSQETVHRQKVAEAQTYSLLALYVERPPNALSLFSTGLDKQLGGTVGVSHSRVPMISDVSGRGVANPYLNLFSTLDLVFIFQVVLSLLALLFAYDAIAGEWENGTLRLVLSHPVRRGLILFAKYVAALLCLLLPVLLSLLLVLVLCTLSGSLQVSQDDFLKIGGIVLTTLVYLSLCYVIGLLISTTTRRAATSLILCMFIWVALVLVYPNWSRFVINPVGDMRAEKLSARQAVKQVWEELRREERRFLANSPLAGKPPMFNLSLSYAERRLGGSRHYGVNFKLNEASEPLVPHVQHFHQVSSAVQIRLAEKSALIRQENLERTDILRAKWDERLRKLSPAGRYASATSAWAGTDLNGMLDFIRAAQVYRKTLIDYFHDKEAFASRLWFASDKGTVDWWDLPSFTFQRADAWVTAQRALPDVLLLLLAKLVLFMLAFLLFLRIEV